MFVSVSLISVICLLYHLGWSVRLQPKKQAKWNVYYIGRLFTGDRTVNGFSLVKFT